MSQNIIRRAVISDAAELARLTTHLGYPASELVIRARLMRMIDSSNDCVVVAEDSNGKLAGWIHGFLSQLLESDYRVEIGGLVVDETRRRNGIGRRLVHAVNDWAVERGATELSVRCREERAESHQFYESLLFQYTKTQRVFRKRTGKP
jgi:GNAT superfamily N-acetyltransferase